ncbi:MAG: hypothetical protein QG597_3876 [Actinomycetota bacterium]|nr:hypothetical protein [Actinomycetota bacterium]
MRRSPEGRRDPLFSAQTVNTPGATQALSRATAVFAALTLAFGVSASTANADIAGATVLPVKTSAYAPGYPYGYSRDVYTDLSAGSEGWAATYWDEVGEKLISARTGQATTVLALPGLTSGSPNVGISANVLNVVGTQAAVAVGRDYCPDPTGWPNDCTKVSVQQVVVVETGSGTIAHTYDLANNELAVGLTSAGLLLTAPSDTLGTAFVIRSATGTDRELLASPCVQPSAAIDADGFLYAEPCSGLQTLWYQPVTGTREQVATATNAHQDFIPALSAGHIGWSLTDYTDYAHVTTRTFWRPRAGGSAAQIGTQREFSMSDNAIAWASGIAALNVRDLTAASPTTRTVTLTGGAEPVVAAGGAADFIAIAGCCTTTETGIFSVSHGSSSATRLADWATDRAESVYPQISGGRLSYTDNSQVGDAGWQRDLGASGGSGTVGAESLLLNRASMGSPPRVSGTWSTNTETWNTTTFKNTVVVRDGATVRATYADLEWDVARAVAASGARIVIDGTVRNFAQGSDKNLAPSGTAYAWSLWGSRGVFSDLNSTVSTLTYKDVDLPASSTNPRLLCSGSTCNGRVQIWGDWVGWGEGVAGSSTGTLHLKNLQTAATRTISNVNQYERFTIGPGEVAYTAGSTVYALDLTDTSSTPVTVGDGSNPTIDARHVAWIGTDGALRVALLPFDTHQRPRLLNGGGEPAFTPNGDGMADTWAAVFDATSPLSSWTVTLKNGNNVSVRTFTGTDAAMGAVRFTWDGEDSHGDPVPDGEYRWEFVADAADGTGAVEPMDGSTVVPTGTVTITHAAPTTLTETTRPTTVRYGGRVAVRGSLTHDGGAPVAGATVRIYQRRHGTSAWTQWSTATTTAAGTWSVTATPGLNTDYLARYAGTTGVTLASDSPVRVVTVGPRVTATASQTTIKLGARPVIGGAVTPNHREQLVYLQRYYTRAWHNVARQALSSASQVRFTVKPTTRGTWQYRVFKPGDADHVAATSPTVTIRVR